MSLTVAILAGGLGTRMSPQTSITPKSLFDVAGKPFVLHQIDLLREYHLNRIVLCVGHLGAKIQEAIGDGHAYDVEIEYVFDGKVPLGTAGALRNAAPVLGDEFFVLYGDSYLDIDYQAVYNEFTISGKEGLMTLYRNLGRWDRSNVLYTDGTIQRYDKHSPAPEMQHIDYGLGILKRRTLDMVPTNEYFDLADVYQELIIKKQLGAFEARRRFFEIGSPHGLQDFQEYASIMLRPGVKTFTQGFLREAIGVIGRLDIYVIERIVRILRTVRERHGRVFFLGVGGGASHASHAVSDFRKIAGLEAYTPTDNVAELTARINDDGWETVYARWLQISQLSDKDIVFVISVGGGDLARNISPNLVRALEYAEQVGATICGIVGRDGGYTAQVAEACLVIPTESQLAFTAHTEAIQSLILHLLVTHPEIQQSELKWESIV